MSRLDRKCQRCGRNFEDCGCSRQQEEDHVAKMQQRKLISKEVARQLKQKLKKKD